MTQPALFYGTLASALGSGLIAGVFFAFSSFVMPALARLPAAQGIASMQSINVVVLNRSFLSVFAGTAGLCLILAVLSLLSWSASGSKLRLVGSALYVIGTFWVTMACNVPMNEALDKVSPDSAQALQAWSTFVPRWTTFNSVRAAAALAATTLLILSLVQSASAD
jgi:uncharacterized membrane protein